MTTKAINGRLEQEVTIHKAAEQIVSIIEAAVKHVDELGGDGDAARDKIVELVTEDD